MKLTNLLSDREKLKRYDELVAKLCEVHTSHLDSVDTSSLAKIGEVLTFERKRAANIERIFAEIVKLDED